MSQPYWTPAALRRYRALNDKSQADMAALLLLRENSYGRLERGESAITPRMNLLLLKLCGRPPARDPVPVE